MNARAKTVAPKGASIRAAAIRLARDTLNQMGYRQIAFHTCADADGTKHEYRTYANHRRTLILKATWSAAEGYEGWEVYGPLTEDNRVHATLEAIRAEASEESRGAYAARVRALEEEGMSTSDAQAAADVEFAAGSLQ